MILIWDKDIIALSYSWKGVLKNPSIFQDSNMAEQESQGIRG